LSESQITKTIKEHVSNIDTPTKIDVTIPKDEDTWNEFKSTFQYDLSEENLRRDGKTEAADARKNNHKSIRDDIQKEVSLTVAAFANQEGGRLFVGVNNDSSVLGLGRDLKEYGNSVDKLTLAITDSLKKYLQNSAFIAKLKFEFADNGDKQYLIIQVPRSTEPIFVNVSNGQEAYVRIQKSSEKFSVGEFLKYSKDRFPN
ncbi:MAG: ATP-binding protein, partial [Candidatus Nitrosopelagicus sp.]|nr:ATP-binding protein [Candidatus Nitrosopelagicus sp.]